MKRKNSIVKMLNLLMMLTIVAFGAAACDGGGGCGWNIDPTPTPTATPGPTSTPGPTATPVATGDCDVNYQFNNWGNTGGFNAEVTVTNTSSQPVDNWTLAWDFTNDQQITDLWNFSYTQNSGSVAISSMEENTETIPSGGSIVIRFNGTYTGTNSTPNDFALNGVACSVVGSGTSPNPTATPTPTTTPTPTPVPGTDVDKVDNPYAGAKFYVNPEWSAKAAAEPGGTAIANESTGVWLDRIAAIDGTGNSLGSEDPMSLLDHLEAAADQSGRQPIVAQFVVYNLPGRDCSALASNGELPFGFDYDRVNDQSYVDSELEKGLIDYKEKYIDVIVDRINTFNENNAKSKFVRIVTIIEIDSLPNLITNTHDEYFVEMCAAVDRNNTYVEGVRYALKELGAISNVYTYVDAAHHGWIGWPNNFEGTANLLKTTILDAGLNVDGFITNTANYSALVEPYLSRSYIAANTNFDYDNDIKNKKGGWVEYNDYVDELSFAQAFRTKLTGMGFPEDIGMLIDTSRNGWGPDRINAPRGNDFTGPDAYVEAVRIDQRIHAGNWCNQSGAGLGERPQANPERGIDAYVWIKPPGESDGSSRLIANDDGKGFDRMCDPTFDGNVRNGNSETGALPNAPISGAWFSEQFQELLRNAYPPLN